MAQRLGILALAMVTSLAALGAQSKDTPRPSTAAQAAPGKIEVRNDLPQPYRTTRE